MIFKLIDKKLTDLEFETGTLDHVISPYELNNLYWYWTKKMENNFNSGVLELAQGESHLIELIGRKNMDLYEYIKEEYNVPVTDKIDCIGR